MKNKFILPLLLITLSILACGKKDKKQYSTWTINSVTFTSNNVHTTIGKARADLACDDADRFGLTFNIGDQLPHAGNFGIEHIVGSAPDSVSVGFYKGTIFYVISPYSHGVISSSVTNNKAKFTLSPTWFVNYHNSADSVKISGEFNEP